MVRSDFHGAMGGSVGAHAVRSAVHCRKNVHPHATCDGGVRYRAPEGTERLASDRFEILNEPTGTYSIFDSSAELPVTGQHKTLIGLSRHEVPLALLAVMEVVGKPWAPPLLSSLSNCRTNNGDQTYPDGSQA